VSFTGQHGPGMNPEHPVRERERRDPYSLKTNLRTVVVVFATWSLLFAIADWLPETGSEVLDSLVAAMSAVVPAIGKLAAASSMPRVTGAFMSIIWVLIVATVLVVAVRGKFPLDSLRVLPRKHRWVLFWVITIGFVVVPLLDMYWGGLEGEKPRTLATDYMIAVQWHALSSRGWRALWGLITYVICSLAITAAIGLVRNFRRLWLLG
jgi:hypothetical protein